MAASIADRVKTAGAELTGEDVLRSRVGVLLGVSQAAQTALEGLNIRTVFDLAGSSVFATAAVLVAAEDDPTRAEVRLNAVAADAAAPPAGVPVRELARRPITILKGIDAATAAALTAALDVNTVRDLALWPPYRTAKAILEDTFFPDAVQAADLEAPPELLPRNGVYPTERVFYSKLLIDLVPQPETGVVALEESGAIDLDAELATPTAFRRLATGALLTFSQSWFSEGLTLGQLLHSTSLAPGESTRLAMIDWSRRTRAAASEDITEAERLSSTQDHNRALNEVTDATAREFQAGTSQSTATSTTSQSGSGFGLEIGPLAFGGSGGKSSTTTEAMSASSSFGWRNLAAELAQTVNDRSQQNASAVRNRRASIVREVSQEEHESISTRVLTNYNHMHALTVEYYEVVQTFRVTTQLDRAERCLFVPLKLVSFQNPATIDRLRPLLADAALTPMAFRQLTSEYGVVEIAPQTPKVTPGRVDLPDIVGGVILLAKEGEEPARGSASPTAAPLRYDRGPATASTTILAVKGWNVDQINRLGSVTGRVPIRSESDSVFVPDDATLVGATLRQGQAAKFLLRKRDNSEVPALETSATTFIPATAVRFSDMQSIGIQNAGTQEVKSTLLLHVNVRGSVVPLDVPIVLKPGGPAVPAQDVVRFGIVRPAKDLVEHLEANRLHYSRAIFRTLDAASLASLLSRFTYRGIPFPQIVDPHPVAVTANFLVFRINVPLAGELENDGFAKERTEWRQFLAKRGLDRPVPRTEIIPLPSGGVFAEAVLGRFNSAEKIDLKRFFNWQDSPIPVVASEIAPVAAGSRAQAETLEPGQLGAPIVSMQTPTALPAAAGVAPMLAAIQSGNIFRDMSGMAQTAAVAQSAMQAAGAGATAAGQQAATNLFTVMDQHTRRMRIAADMVSSIMSADAAKAASASTGGTNGGGGTRPAGGVSVSERGGQLEAAAALDRKAESSGGAEAGGGEAASLEADALRGQTGASAADAAEKVVDVATKPPARVRTRRRRSPSTGAGQSTPSDPWASPGGTATGEPISFPLSPRRFVIHVVFDPSRGVAIEGGRSAKVTDSTGKTIFESRADRSPALVGSFESKETAFNLEVDAFGKPDRAPLKGFQRIAFPQGWLDSILGGMQVTLILRVSPNLRSTNLEIPFAPGGFSPDMTELARQLHAKGITPFVQIGDPKFELHLDRGYTVTVLYFSDTLSIKQIIE